MEVKFHQRPKLKAANMVAAWPGMGYVALEVGSYLRRKLGAELFAEIEPHNLFDYEGVSVKDGVAGLPGLPRSKFYYWKGQPESGLIIFLGEAQPHGRKGCELVDKVLDVAQALDVKRIYTAAAFPTPMSHKQRPRVWGVANTPELLDLLRDHNLKILSQGSISGLNGLVLGYARQRGIDGICLLGELPLYTINIENPKASGAVLEVLTKMLGIEIDMDEIEYLAERTEEEIERQIEKLHKGIEEGAEFKPEATSDEYDKVPSFVRKKIEKLFREAEKDRTKAPELKTELDRWDLFKEYEDRFLDLFKRHRDSEG